MSRVVARFSRSGKLEMLGGVWVVLILLAQIALGIYALVRTNHIVRLYGWNREALIGSAVVIIMFDVIVLLTGW